MARYVPSGKVGAAGLLTTLLLGLVGGSLVGGLVHFVGRFFYLILMFPLFWGLVVGFLVAAGARMGKCRSVSFATIAAVLAALNSYGTYHVGENLHVRSQLKEFLREKGGDPDALYAEYLKENFGGTGFEAELKMRAGFGMSIGRVGRNAKDKPLISGAGMYVYWGVEALILAGLAAMIARQQAKELFCERCLAWYEARPAFSVASAKVGDAVGILNHRDWSQLAACAGAGGVLSLQKCPSCQEAPVGIVLENVTADAKGKETRTKVHEDLLSRDEANAMLAALAPPPPKA